MSTSQDVRRLAKEGYDKSAHRYLEWVSKRPGSRLIYIEKLLKFLPNAGTAHILELGCGAGLPCTKLLAENCGHVTANDISQTQIALAKDKLSVQANVDFVEGDMTALEFSEDSFDAITAFYSIIHLDAEGQISMLRKIRKWLKPGGYFLCNLAGAEEKDPGTMEEDWLGMQAFWSSFGRTGNLQLMQNEGFEVLEYEVTDEVEDAPFLWMIAQPK